MKHPTEVLRNFNKTDDEMLLQSEVQLSLFNDHKGRFVDSFPPLADPFANEWASAISSARRTVPDYAALSQQASQKDALEELMEQGRTLYQSLILYTRLAYPGDATILRLFGQPQYEVARRSALKMPVLLRMSYATASIPDNKSRLLAKGMKEEDIESMLPLADQIVNQEIAQEKARNARLLDTTERILAMNAVWEKTTLVSQCAKMIFQDDATLYSLFLLDDGSSPAKSTAVNPVPPAPAV